MPEAVPINMLAVLVCALSNMALGFAWYGPLFGKPWMKEMGIDPATIDKAKMKGMHKTYAIALLGAFLTAYVMAHSMAFAEAYLKTSGVMSGLTGGFWNWLGFVAPVTVGMVLWEKKSWKLWKIVSGYHLVSLCIMGVILSLWK